jgi:hypothetical protein
MKIGLLLLTSILFFCPTLTAQSVADIEKDLTNKLITARKFVKRGQDYDYDRFVKANGDFETALLRYCQDPETLRYAFPELGDEMEIVTSADKRFRIYSWDLGYGGTMRHHMSVIQYEGASGKTYGWEPAKKPDSGIGGLYRSIFEVPTRGGKIYLAESETIISRSDRVRELKTFEVEADTLRPDVKLIRTSSGPQNEISLEYNYFSLPHDDEGNVRLFYFDPAKKSFRYPEISRKGTSGRSRVTGKFIVYSYDGKYFVRHK